MNMHWGCGPQDAGFVASANRIVAALRKRDGPVWEKELREIAGVTSIGAYFQYLAVEYGVLKIVDWGNRPDDDNKLYVLSHRVHSVDQRGQEVPVRELYTYRP